MNTQEIFDNALRLSVSERLADFNNGKTQAIPSDKIFSEIRGQFDLS